MTNEEKILENKRLIARTATGLKPYHLTPAEARDGVADAIVTFVPGVTIQDALRITTDKKIASVLFACMREEKSHIWRVLTMALVENVVRDVTGSDVAAVAELAAIVNNTTMQPAVLEALYSTLCALVHWLPIEPTAHFKALIVAAVIRHAHNDDNSFLSFVSFLQPAGLALDANFLQDNQKRTWWLTHKWRQALNVIAPQFAGTGVALRVSASRSTTVQTPASLNLLTKLNLDHLKAAFAEKVEAKQHEKQAADVKRQDKRRHLASRRVEGEENRNERKEEEKQAKKARKENKAAKDQVDLANNSAMQHAAQPVTDYQHNKRPLRQPSGKAPFVATSGVAPTCGSIAN